MQSFVTVRPDEQGKLALISVDGFVLMDVKATKDCYEDKIKFLT